jgi:general secretion pathway protein M
MITYWNQLKERERWLVGFGGTCLILFLFYQLIYSPLTNAVHYKTTQLREKKETLAWMQQIQGTSLNKKALEKVSSSKLLTIISSKLNVAPFLKFPFQLQQTGIGDIQLTFDKVPYTPFLSWLWTLSNHYTVSLKQFSVERTKLEGIVKLRIILSAS